LIEAHDRLLLKKYIRLYRRVISTSETYAKHSRILRHLGDLVTVIPNGVDCERFNPGIDGTKTRGRLGIDDKFTLIFVAALTKWHSYKGLDVLLKALKSVSDTRADFVLLVVGDGDMKESYRSLCRELNLERTVLFVGDVPDDKLPEYYAASDALVLPSKDMSEGFGLTLLEANATGIPVIASNIGGIPSVVQEGYNGLLVSPNDPDALGRSILRLKEAPQKVQELK
jgi:glycosyltransferase involved in cell wall biosynthesis